MHKIQIRPKLARSRTLSKYIKSIDKNRYYSNFGPLYNLAKKKIIKDFNLKKNSVIFTSSGHSSIVACFTFLRENSSKKYILVPSFNFYSGPQAIINSGFEPYFIDINLTNFSINFDDIKKAFKKLKGNVAGILAVSPFGYPLDVKKLNSIQKKFKTKIIYDAADAFINFDKKIDKSEILICCSFHPTKTLPANESGLIICPKKNYENLKSIISFGCKNKNTDVYIKGFNGKFSEYDAAIFLANYEFKNNVKKIVTNNNKYFSKKIKQLNNSLIYIHKDFGNKWISSRVCCISKKIGYKILKKKFNKLGIQIYSGWNDLPIHLHTLFKNKKKTKLKNTLFIKDKFFIIPLNIDIKKKQIDFIISSIDKIFK